MPGRFFHAKKEVMEVPNEENLIPVRSESEAREKGGRGGKASGEARRKKKELPSRGPARRGCLPNCSVCVTIEERSGGNYGRSYRDPRCAGT